MHLDFRARDRIEALWRAGHEQQEIATILGVHKSTVCREIRNRKKENGEYRADVADHKAGVKRSNSKYQGMKIEQNPKLRKYIVSELKRFQSPECIAGKMREEKMVPRVSSDAIYRWLRSSMGQRYCRYLCTKRCNKKPHSEAPKRHIIPNMVSIHNRPIDPGWVTEGDTFEEAKAMVEEAIAGYLEDASVVEVMLNPDGRLWIDRLTGGLEDTGCRIAPAERCYDSRSGW